MKTKLNHTLLSLALALFTFALPLATPSDAQAMSNISAEDAAREIVGSWKLLSYTDAENKRTSYENDNKIWTFTGSRLDVDSNDLGGKREGAYNLVRSKYRISNTVIILCDELEVTHLSFGKFVVISIENDVLTLSNWEDDIEYILRRVKG